MLCCYKLVKVSPTSWHLEVAFYALDSDILNCNKLQLIGRGEALFWKRKQSFIM